MKIIFLFCFFIFMLMFIASAHDVAINVTKECNNYVPQYRDCPQQIIDAVYIEKTGCELNETSVQIQNKGDTQDYSTKGSIVRWLLVLLSAIIIGVGLALSVEVAKTMKGKRNEKVKIK